VTRQLVYRFFASRQALIVAVLEDFVAELTGRFGRVRWPAFPEPRRGPGVCKAVCDTIEEGGFGTSSTQERTQRGSAESFRTTSSSRGTHEYRTPSAPVSARPRRSRA
jgi:AcrR family transcriptional regulator